MNIKGKALSLVQKYESRNPFQIIQNINAIVVFYPLEGVRGFYQYFQKTNIIYIDERLSDREKLFVCAHELGHMFLHRNSNAIFMDSRTHFKTDKFESEADIFAMELLISDDVINENKDFTVEQMARALGYEQRLIELKLRNSRKEEYYGIEI